jgi:hypothetical protein
MQGGFPELMQMQLPDEQVVPEGLLAGITIIALELTFSLQGVPEGAIFRSTFHVSGEGRV